MRDANAAMVNCHDAERHAEAAGDSGTKRD
jgi:hypothetical protein